MTIKEILINYGSSIDPQGYDDGDINTAIKELTQLTVQNDKRIREEERSLLKKIIKKYINVWKEPEPMPFNGDPLWREKKEYRDHFNTRMEKMIVELIEKLSQLK